MASLSAVKLKSLLLFFAMSYLLPAAADTQDAERNRCWRKSGSAQARCSNIIAQVPVDGAGPSPPAVPGNSAPAGRTPTTAVPWQHEPSVLYPGASQPPGSSPWSGQGPIIVPPISFVDVASGRFGKLEIDLEDGRFMAGGVDRLHLLAKEMDLTTGTLSALSIDIKGGHFEDFTWDRLLLTVQEPLSFDTGSLLNRRMLQFTTPAAAKVTAVVTEASLNRFLNSPQTLERLSVNAVGHNFLGGILAQLGGSADLGISFKEGTLSLQPNNRIVVTMQARAGMGSMAVPLPVEADTRAILKDGWINLSDTRVSTNGQEISPQLSGLVAERINALAGAGSRSQDIRFVFTDLKIAPGDRIVMTGLAYVNRLRF